MSSETLFLESTSAITVPNPNFVNAQGFSIFSNYSHSPLGTLSAAQAESFVKGGVATAMAQAGASIFKNDPTFSELFTNNLGVGVDGAFAGSSNSETKVVASFQVGACQRFSFDFSASLGLIAKEIENPKTEYNRANYQIGFLVLDTTNRDQPQVLDYFHMGGKLISSGQVGSLELDGSEHITINSRNQTKDINGNNGQDFLTGEIFGRYQRTFKQDTQITLVQINVSDVRFAGDTLIGNLGKDVIYGTIWNDNLKGTNGADKIYGSLGDDLIRGENGNDILEGGQGNDTLIGGQGNDKLHGGWGDDVLIGGRGNDVLVGGQGADKFVFNRLNSWFRGELDVIEDFQVGIDKIVFQNWGCVNPMSKFDIFDTQNGVMIKSNVPWCQGAVLLTGLNSSQITPQSIEFV